MNYQLILRDLKMRFCLLIFLFVTSFAWAEEVRILSIEADSDTSALLNKFGASFEKVHENVRVEISERRGGITRENQVRQDLATGNMADIFLYNTGSLLRILEPEIYLQPLESLKNFEAIDKKFQTAARVGDAVYAVPLGNPMVGGVLFNRRIYEDLSLSRPHDWDELMKNAKMVQSAGIDPFGFSLGTTWSTQLLMLADYHNLEYHYPEFSEDYTKGKLKFAEIKPEWNSFHKLAEIDNEGLLNADADRLIVNEALEKLANGRAAHVVVLSTAIRVLAENHPEKFEEIGYFPIPPKDPRDEHGTTVWMPAGLYITRASDNKDLALAFFDYILDVANCDLWFEYNSSLGSSLNKNCEAKIVDAQVIVEINQAFESPNSTLALEFLSPLKGPSLENITTQLLRGEMDVATASEAYDRDIERRALELGLK